MNSIYNFINEFNYLTNSDKYISKKDINKLLDKYKYILENIELIDDKLLKDKTKYVLNNIDKIMDIKNEKFVASKLIEYKDYFDNMFKGIDDSIVLDQEQRISILTDEDYSLVIAGAGSGKTTTMAAKVKYLVDKMHVKEDKIILLAFTNKACEELQSRITDDFKLNIEVLTFHKLGMKFIRQIMSKPISIVGAGTFHMICEKYITEYLFKDKDKLKKFMETFKDYVYFDQKALSYDSFDEYFKYYADKTYELNKNNLKQYCDLRIKNRLENNRSISGEIFRSSSEAMIANYLYINSIDYTYEKTYPHKLEEGRSYIPDFTIDNNGVNVYIEFYGLSKYYTDGNFSEDEIEYYKKLINKKRDLHKKYGTDLIELYYEYDFNTNYLKELDKNITSRYITKIPKKYKEVFYTLLYTSKEVQYFKVVNLFETFISRFKEKGYSLKDFETLINEEKDNAIKEQLIFIKEIYIYYEKEIHDNNKIDFQDMINYAYRFSDNLKNKNYNYDYIIIDEYQDISKQRYNFAKKISDLFNAKIVAVGDDWQAIYGFSGSDIELFTKFYDLMGYASITKIKNTYRNSQELLDITSDFVSKDQSIFNKELKSNKHLDKPIEIYYYDLSNDKSKYDSLVSIIKKIYDENHDSKILLLSRFSKEKDELIKSRYFASLSKDKLVCRKVMDANIDFLTVHKSKGLGYDQVIILNGLNDTYGFPSKVKDDEVLKVLDKDKISYIDYPEERRLFYVALTRTKNKVYILSPYLPMEKRSEFIREIENNENVSRNLMI